MKNYRTEILAGLTVAMALIPEALAFSLVAGVPPSAGLYSAFVLGLITAIFGGRPGMISGATGAVAVGLASLTSMYGIEYIFPTVILAGFMQMLAGFFKLEKLIRLVSYPVMLGFVNGLAILLLLTQVGQFNVVTSGCPVWMAGNELYTMMSLVGLAIAVMLILPKINKSIPAGLTAIFVVSLLVIVSGIRSKTVGDVASISAGFPPFHIPEVPFSFETLRIIFPYASIMAGVGLLESLLTIKLIDQITGSKGNGNRECFAQGAANILSGFFSGMGGCAMIGQSLVNMAAGGRSRVSGIVASLMILTFILFGAALIERIPMAALTGLMIVVSVGTFKKGTLKMMKRPSVDLAVCILVTGITVISHNLALAVIVGVIISALVFVWDLNKRLRINKYTDTGGVLHYEVHGTLFFGSVTTFLEHFDVGSDPTTIVVDFSDSRVADLSAVKGIDELIGRYERAGKKIISSNSPLS